MKKQKKLTDYFVIPENDDATGTDIFMMKDGIPQRYSITIQSTWYGNRISSYLGDTPILSTKVNRNLNDCDMRDIHKSVRIHLREIFKNSDISPMLNRYFGILSTKLMRTYLDEFTVNCLQEVCIDEKTFSAKYRDIVNDLITKLDTKTRDILQSIKTDYITIDLPEVVLTPLMRYNEMDAKFTQKLSEAFTNADNCTIKIPLENSNEEPPFKIRVTGPQLSSQSETFGRDLGRGFTIQKRLQEKIEKARISGDKDLKKLFEFDSIQNMVYFTFYKNVSAGDRISSGVNDDMQITDDISLGEFADGYLLGKTIIKYIVNRSTKDIIYPIIQDDKFSIVFMEYNNNGYGVSVIVGEKRITKFYERYIDISDIVCDILENANKLDYIELYTEKKTRSIRNLWGLLPQEIHCI